MSKETNKIPFPEHLRRLEEFKRAIKEDVDPLFDDVAFRVIDNLELAERLRELNILLKKAEGIEKLSYIKVDVSVYLWSNKKATMNAATERVIENAYRLNAILSENSEDVSVFIESLKLSPLEKLGILDYRIDGRTGELYKHFRDIEFVFAKEGDGKDRSL